jgi:hypothetical protein
VGEARQLADQKRRQLCVSIDTESLGWAVTQCNWSFPSSGALPVCAQTPPPAIQKLESNKTGEAAPLYALRLDVIQLCYSKHWGAW